MTIDTATLPARARDVLACEWIKLRSVRSSYWALLAAAVAAVAIGYLVTGFYATHWATMSAKQKAHFDPVFDTFSGLVIAQLAFGTLGVLAISCEHTTGLIRTTYTAIPQRHTVLAAKAAVTGAVALAAGELIALAAFFAGQAVLSRKHLDVTLGSPSVLRGVLAAGAYLTVVALVGMGLGAVIRHTAGAIAAMSGLVFLAPQIIHVLPKPWDTTIGKYLLDSAARQMIGQHPSPGYLPAGPSALICAAYVAAPLAAAAFLITRRDA